MRCALLIPVVAAVLVGLPGLTGCCKEHRELADDFRREGDHAEFSYRQLKVELERYAISNKLWGTRVPFDVNRFLEWRKREWWHLTDRFAWLIAYEWGTVERLSIDAGRLYGYEITNFPRNRQDILTFLVRADPEWRNLVMDMCIFVEWKKRESYKIVDEFAEFLATASWEAASFELEVKDALAFRRREYLKFARDGRDWWASSQVEWDRLRLGWIRFQAHSAIEGKRLRADFRFFYSAELAQVPRLFDEWVMWAQFRERELWRLQDELRQVALSAHFEWLALGDDLRRWKEVQLAEIPKLMLDVEHFFVVYEREIRPLSDEVKRFWRVEIAARHLAIADLRRYLTLSAEETAELEFDVKRFVVYGSVEWRHLVATFRRFATCAYDPAFGDPAMPMAGRGGPTVFNDHTPPQTFQVAQ